MERGKKKERKISLPEMNLFMCTQSIMQGHSKCGNVPELVHAAYVPLFCGKHGFIYGILYEVLTEKRNNFETRNQNSDAFS